MKKYTYKHWLGRHTFGQALFFVFALGLLWVTRSVFLTVAGIVIALAAIIIYALRHKSS